MIKDNLLTPIEVSRMKKDLEGKKYSMTELMTSEGYTKYFNRTAKFVTGQDIRVIFSITAETAYTTGKEIVINPILFPCKSFSELTTINLGFLAHEIYHILFTDFGILKEIFCSRVKVKRLLKDITNIVEDSAIEYFGALIYKGDFKHSVAYLNATIFEESPLLGEDVDESQKIMSAMCLFGSCGKIKGSSPRLWDKIAGIMTKARTCISPRQRYNYSMEIYELVEEFFPIYEGMNSKKGNNSNVDNSDFRLTEEEIKDLLKDSSPEDGKESTDIFDSVQEIIDSKERKTESSKEEKTSSPSKYEGLENEMEKECKGNELKERIASSKESKIKEMSNKIDYGRIHEKVKNNIECMKVPYVHEKRRYGGIVQENSEVINSITRKLKKIAKTAMPETYDKQSKGVLSLKNLASPNLFTDGKVFKREKEGKDFSFTFTILVDESGSMGGKRIQNARKAAIVFNEVSRNLNIPVMVLGFSACFEKAEVGHTIYKDFSSPDYFRYNIAKIKNKEDNRDGYSIRFTGELIHKMSPNTKNFLIVISDGLPLHRIDRYSRTKGEEDTKRQIEYIQKKFKIPSVALNISGHTGFHEEIYKKVINIKDLSSLSTQLVNILKKEFKN